MAMPGAPREVALRSRPGEAPVHAAPRMRTSRGYPTGAGTEPLRLGEARDPRVPKALGLNAWHHIKANRYK